MPGVRLRHPTARGGVYLVEDLARRYNNPLHCAACSAALNREIVHHVKTYHLMLSAQGTVIVSEGIYERLRTVPGLGGLEVMNKVAAPPEQRLEVNGRPRVVPIVRGQQDFRPSGGGK